jgi:hypothetical protein
MWFSEKENMLQTRLYRPWLDLTILGLSQLCLLVATFFSSQLWLSEGQSRCKGLSKDEVYEWKEKRNWCTIMWIVALASAGTLHVVHLILF